MGAIRRDGGRAERDGWSATRREADVVDIDGYADLEPIGGGGSSTVYRAWQSSVRRWVAVKVVDGRAASAADLERETELHARLAAHPHVVPLFDAGPLSGGRAFVAMQLYDGSARDRLDQDGAFTEADVLAVAAPIAGALAAAHSMDVVHGDVKPENVLLSSTAGPGLADFGLARSRTQAAGRDGDAPDGLTPRHAAPEVLAGAAPSEAADVWSFGSTLYTLLANRPPFASEPDEAYANFIRRVAHEVPRSIARRIDPDLMDVVLSCLEKRPEGRPTAADVQCRLGGLARRSPVGAPPTVRSPLTALRPGPPGRDGSAAWAGDAAGAGPTPQVATPTMTIPGGDDGDLPPGPAPAFGAGGAGTWRMGLESGVTVSRARPNGSDPERPAAPDKARWPLLVVGAAGLLLVAAIVARVALKGDDQEGTGADGGPAGSVVVPSSVPPAAVADDLAPTDLVADDFGDTVDLHWTDNADGGLTYIVVYRAPGGDQQTTNVDPGATDITIRGLDPDLGYCFRVLGTGQSTSGELVQAHADTSVRGCVPEPAAEPGDDMT